MHAKTIQAAGHDPMREWSTKIRLIMDEMRKRSFVHFRDSGCWQPAVNLYESDRAFHVCVALAGMRRDGIDVTCLDEHRLVISGHREQPQPADAAAPLSILAMEIDSGNFARQLELPLPFDIENVAATYREGLLWITLPKANAR